MENRKGISDTESFIRSVIKKQTGFMHELERYAEEYFIPIVTPETAAFLRVMVRIIKPRRILEAGTAIGYSAIVFAEASGKDTLIDTIENDEGMADAAEANIRRMGYEDRIRVIRGDALEVLQCLTTEYDMIFLDAAKGQYVEYLPECLRLTSKGGVIISDNILYKGLVAAREGVGHKHRTIAVRMKEYVARLCESPHLDTAIIPVGDGMAVSYRL
jgi:predicted O-methyltransferase YrrM